MRKSAEPNKLYGVRRTTSWLKNRVNHLVNLGNIVASRTNCIIFKKFLPLVAAGAFSLIIIYIFLFSIRDKYVKYVVIKDNQYIGLLENPCGSSSSSCSVLFAPYSGNKLFPLQQFPTLQQSLALLNSLATAKRITE